MMTMPVSAMPSTKGKLCSYLEKSFDGVTTFLPDKPRNTSATTLCCGDSYRADNLFLYLPSSISLPAVNIAEQNGNVFSLDSSVPCHVELYGDLVVTFELHDEEGIPCLTLT